ncbi:MsnO8 family LLM class oxidoreductase [Paenibacillus jiagnxiensis]|uniref:MsnO8 family LLM class oxidoreductase n=1 Tax=Paenibacillus jiagnxiensis TaxID=3228926 RepID=UPI0033AA807A
MTKQPIRLGVLDLVPVLGGSSAEEAVRRAGELARLAEAWGYHRYWTSEHHDIKGLASASPEVLLAHIGAVTSSIQLGSGAILLPHYNPLKVAEWFNLLAALYPGRVELGIGRAPGGGAHASMALSGNFLERVAKMPETIASLKELLEGSYRYDDVPVTAQPVPELPPSLWMLGTNRKGAEYAARYGTGYVFGQFMSDQDGREMLEAYREAFSPSANLPAPRTMVAVGVVCAETEEAAYQLAEQARSIREGDLMPGPERKGGGWLIGSASQVGDKLRELQQHLQTDDFLLVTEIADYEERLKSYRLLSEYFRE